MNFICFKSVLCTISQKWHNLFWNSTKWNDMCFPPRIKNEIFQFRKTTKKHVLWCHSIKKAINDITLIDGFSLTTSLTDVLFWSGFTFTVSTIFRQESIFYHNVKSICFSQSGYFYLHYNLQIWKMTYLLNIKSFSKMPNLTETFSLWEIV